MPGIAAFSDDIRDGIKGHWSNHESKGFVGGDHSLKESVKFGIVGATQHSQINYSEVNNSDTSWVNEPGQCMVYVSCHDNHTLYDKLKIANPDATENEIQKMHILSNAIVLTSQGVPFLHAGTDFLRTKMGVENSYQSPDSINQIKWLNKSIHLDVFNSYKSLIHLRAEHSAFRLGKTSEIQKRLMFLDSDPSMIVYTIDCHDSDSWDRILLIFKGDNTKSVFQIPEGNWRAKYLNSKEGNEKTVNGELDVLPYTYTVLYEVY